MRVQTLAIIITSAMWPHQLGAQQAAPAAAAVSPPGAQRVSTDEVRLRLEQSKGIAPEWMINQDAQVITKVVSVGTFDRLATTKDATLDAVTASWAAVHVDANRKTKGPVSFGELTAAVNNLRQLIVESKPDGATVEVDGYRWQDSTRADGFASVGDRNLVVIKDGVRVAFVCKVTTQTRTIAAVDFSARSGHCQ